MQPTLDRKAILPTKDFSLILNLTWNFIFTEFSILFLKRRSRGILFLMSFMSSDPPLAGTIFTENDLKCAKQTWIELENCYVPGWFAYPVGCLGTLFQSQSPRDAFLLIDIAYALNLLLNQNVTQDSLPVLKEKIRCLMIENRESAFNELLTEIMVASYLCRHISPIAFEPYITKREREGWLARLLRRITKTSGKQLASPDYAVVLPDGTVAIEVTVLYLGHLQSWQKLVDEIRDVLKAKLLQADGIYRDIELQLPLNFNRKLGNKFCERKVTDKIIHEEQGEFSLELDQHPARLRWRPMSIYDRSNFNISKVPAEANCFAVADVHSHVRNGFGFTSRPIGTREQFEEFMFRSLANTLTRKRNQFREKNQRYILILKLGHSRMPSELLHDLFRKRIWPNSKFNWLTCFGEFRPRCEYGQASPGQKITFQTNPNGKPLPGSFLENLLNGQKTFHTNKGMIKVGCLNEKDAVPIEHPSPLGGFRGKLAVGISKARYLYKIISGQK
jgi:hypothetical protein